MNRQMRRQMGIPNMNTGNIPQMTPQQIVNTMGGPREAVMMMMQQPQFKNNRVVQGLIQKMEAGDEAAVMAASRNIFKENQQDFDQQFNGLHLK